MKNILITGGAGFIGSHLIKLLLSRYPEYNIVYNKLEIAQFQNLNCNPFPCYPDSFPIVSKPIVNLYGMGLNSKKL